jgi:hypothetical protein
MGLKYKICEIVKAEEAYFLYLAVEKKRKKVGLCVILFFFLANIIAWPSLLDVQRAKILSDIL